MASVTPDLYPRVLRLEDISFSTNYSQVLENLSLDICSREIHAVLGENGSGKSTLGKIISGALKPSSGRIIREDSSVACMVHQDRVANENFLVWEYLFFDNDRAYSGFFMSRRKIHRMAEAVLEEYGLKIDLDKRLKELKSSEYTAVELIRQIEKKPDILVLDEIFMKLGSEYSKIFTALFHRLKRRGMAVLFITHDIEKLYDFADKVSILRNGEILFTGPVDSIDKLNIIRLAYTETVEKVKLSELQSEFYHFLKFNEAILNTLPINLAVIDPEFKIIMANRSFERHFEISREAYLYRNISFIFSEQKNDVYKLIMASLDSTETQSFFDVPITIGSHYSINTLKVVPIYDGVNNVGHILIIEDVTDYYSLQKKIMLSENLSSIGLLAAGVGHEINNSLEIVLNYLHFIRNSIDDEKLLGPLGDLKEELDFITQIVSRLVTFSETNVANSEEFDANTMIENYIRLIHKNDIYGNIKFSVDIQADPLIINMNKNEFRQVLVNLIKNACEATGDGGNVIITLSLQDREGAAVSVIEIEDDGPGIPVDKMDSVFTPFFSTKSADSKNIGLGLSLCYSIITKSGGTIKAVNTEGGCRFTIELPQADVE
ncbi:MAG TPA: hypothetical protein DCO79_02735 [Spirochaeta sp.]|nr:hypothetical protein [Spirochaeta sp.]